MSSPSSRQRSAGLDIGRRAIRLQLALLVLVVTVPMLLLLVWNLVSEREQARAVARDQVKLAVDGAAGRLEASLRANEAMLSMIAAQPLVRAMDPANCDPLVKDFIRLHPEYVTIGTRDLQGNPVCTFRPDPPGQHQVAAFAWFQQSLRSGKFHVGDAFFAPLARRWVTVVTAPVFDDNKRQSGMVALPLDLLALNQAVTASAPANLLVSVIDREFNMALRSTDPQAWIGKPVPGPVRALMQAQAEGFLSATGADGVRRLMAFKRLPGTGWRVAAGMPEDEVFAAADAALRNGLLAGLALLVAAFGLAWSLAQRIARPLDQLAATARSVTTGDTQARVRSDASAPELATVALAFNHMLDALARAQHAVRDSEENLAITLQSIGDAVIATDASGRVTRMNPAAKRLTGWRLADARGRALGEVFVISDSVTGEASLDPVQRVLASGEVVGLANHTSLRSRDGAEYQISDSAAPIRDAGGQVVGVVLVFSDITEKYRLQRVLVESEVRYRALVESSPVGVAVHQQGLLAYVNPMAVRIAGAIGAHQVLGRPFMDFIHPDFRAEVAERTRRMLEQGATLDAMELQYIRLDGSHIDVQAQGTAITFEGRPAVQLSIVDISQRKRTERILRENEARFRALTRLSSDWYWEQDAQFRFVSVDGGFPGLHGSRNAERLGKKRWELGARNVTASDWERHRAVLNAHQEFRDFQLLRRDRQGRDYWVSVSGTPIFDAQGVFRGYRGVGRDITAEKLAADQIHALAFYDALTELPNRRLLIEQLKKALVTHARNHRQFALLFIDLDNFKTLNDTLGHETGDLLLRDVARRLLACVREADSVARLGGDEFVVMLEDLSEELGEAAAQAELVGHKILAAFSTPYVLGAREYRSTPSIGITLLAQGNQGVEDLLKQADLAMYQAKAAGRNTMRQFDQGMQAAVDARVAIESDLREGLSGSQMLLHFQPIVRSDGIVTGAEALVRWQHPSRGLVHPGEFIHVAESTRLIQPLGQWVLDTACAQLAAWARMPRYQHLTLSVNVSAHQFKEPDFVALVERALDRAGAEASKLKLELTESLLADNIDEVVVKMAELRDRGINFSLDDFGTGYSSLSYLKRLPLAQLKIDQSFVRDVLVDANDAAIARTIVALGASLGLGVVAEGVETQGQHQFLLAIGCHAFQGYFIGRPCAVAEFEDFVQASRSPAS